MRILAPLLCFIAVSAQALVAAVPDSLAVLQTDKGKLTAAAGFEKFTDFVDCFAQELQQPIDWVSLPTTRLAHDLNNNTLDMIYPMGFTSERNKSMRKSEYMTQSKDLWLSNTPFNEIDIATAIKAAKTGSPQQQYFEANSFSKTLYLDQYEGLIHVLNAYRVDLVAIPEEVYIALNKELGPLEFHTHSYLTREVGMYFARNIDEPTKTRYDQAILACR